MKKLFVIFTLLFSTLVYSSPSYATWTLVGNSTENGSTYYAELDRIRKHSGYIYFWSMEDGLKPNNLGALSIKAYHEADCKLFKINHLSFALFKQPMGEGTPYDSWNTKTLQWVYPTPGSINNSLLESACSH